MKSNILPKTKGTTILYKKLVFLAFMILVVQVIGTAGYMIIQPEFTALEAFFQTSITLTSVGFEEVYPFTPASMMFTIILLIGGIGVFAYGITSITAIIFEGQLKNTFRENKMLKKIGKLNGHIIVCGYGRLGAHAVKELERWNKPYVIIELEESIAEKLKEEGKLCIHGNAEADHILEEAGIEHAWGLISALDEDASNLFVTLTARRYSKDLHIIARAEYDSSEVKLYTAGANKVLSPTHIAGRRMANLLIHPEVVNFLDVVIGSEDLNLSMQEIPLGAGSKLDNVQIKDSKLPPEIKIIGIKSPGEKMIVNPPATETLKGGRILIVLGENQVIDKVRDEISA